MFLLNHTCDVYRLQAIGTNGRKSLQLVKTAVPCLGLPLGATITVQNQMQLGRSYQFNFGPDADVRVGDRLKWHDTNMSVKFVRSYVDTPPVSHIEAMCEQEVA